MIVKKKKEVIVQAYNRTKSNSVSTSTPPEPRLMGGQTGQRLSPVLGQFNTGKLCVANQIFSYRSLFSRITQFDLGMIIDNNNI